MRCVCKMSVTTHDYEDYNNYAHIHVFMLCCSRVHVVLRVDVVDVSLDLGFHVVIGVGRVNV